MSQYLLNIDSTYRDNKQYPLSTEFGVIVNGTPGNQSAGNVYNINNIVYSRFSWSGTSTTTVENDTIEGNFQSFATTVIKLAEKDASSVLNFYLGCTFVMVSTGASAVIVYYDPSQNTVTLANPIPLTDYNASNTSYQIINPSYVYKNEMLLLGSNVYVSLLNENRINLYYLKTGPTKTMYVQNVDKNWILPIYKVLQDFRIVMFEEDMPSYQNGDLFQIRSTDNIDTYLTLASSQEDSILEYQIQEQGVGYQKGDHVRVGTTGNAEYVITRTTEKGLLLALVLTTAGSGYEAGTVHPLVSLTTGNRSATIRVLKTASSVKIKGYPSHSQIESLLYDPYLSPLAQSLFNVLDIQQDTIFFQNSAHRTINQGIYIELLQYHTVSTGLTMPVVSYRQPVCYDVALVHLILPNQPVRGFNVLPTFFPYLMIELYNTSIPGSNVGVLYTNNPNAERVTFYCPIGNPRNPFVVSYIIVGSVQVQTLKWTPTDNFYFRVLLPNGETLRYNFDQDLNESDVIQGVVKASVDNQFYFFGQLTDRRVSATFSFRLRM